MIRSFPESILPATESRLLHQGSSSCQRVEKVTMISPDSPGAASPKDGVKPQTSMEKPVHQHQASKTDTRTIRFAKQHRIKPISNSLLLSDKMRALLWYPTEELEERKRHWKNDDPNKEVLRWEEGLFFLQMLDCCQMEAPQDDWAPHQEERVHSAVDAVLCEQGRQNSQLQFQPKPPETETETETGLEPVHHQLSPSREKFSEIGISKEEKSRWANKDQTPLFMVALQYSWHTQTTAEAAKNRAIQLSMEIQRLWQDDDAKSIRDTVSPEDAEEEKKEEREAVNVQVENDDETEEESLNDVLEVPRIPLRLVRGMSDHSAFSDLGGLQKKGSSRSMFDNSMDSLLHPEHYLGDRVHLSLPTIFAGREHPQISAALKKQRSRARLSALGFALKEDIQVSGTKMMKLNVLKSIGERGAISLDKDGRKEAFQASVKKLITLNRFFQQVDGVSKDKALDTDKKKFLAAIAAKKSSVFQSIEYNIDETGNESKPTTIAKIQVQSILLTPTIKALRPKQNVAWREKLHRFKFFPVFPVLSEKDKYFYTSEDISRFRFEKFMEDNNDEYEEEVVDSEEENELEALDEDDDESSYEELSYHSDTDSYYEEEEEVEEPGRRDLESRLETQSLYSEGRRLSL
ncbi:MAG: hypothetical protein SGBAC_012224 [Bacillariaceae sp.]